MASAKQLPGQSRPGTRPPWDAPADFIHRCQRLVAAWPELDPDERYRGFVDTLRHAPRRCETAQSRTVVAGLIHEIATRFLRERAQAESWFRLRRQSGEHLAAGRSDELERAGSTPLPSSAVIGNVHARMALEILAVRCTDPKLTLGAVAAAVGVSRWHLSRLLKVSTGLGFRRLLAELRVSHARSLLRKTPLSIKEIAARTGYEHVSNLDRHFRLCSGTTPRRYREIARA
jgi:AraC-like DNA-binding protein